MNTVALTVIGSCIASLLTYLGVRFTARQSREATMQATQVDGRRQRAEEFEAIIAGLREDIKRMGEESKDLRSRVRELEIREDRQREVLLKHSAWDYSAVQALRDCAGCTSHTHPAISDPPPLTPPREDAA